jgi:nucleoid DNA-binding protein
MAGAAAAALGSSSVAVGNKPAKPTAKSRYYARLATEASVSTSAVQALFEHIGKQARNVMRSKGCFRLHNIASFSLNTCGARPGRTHKIQGRVFKSKPQPCTQRVRCSVAKALEQSALASTPPSQNNKKASQTQTPAAKARSHELANLIGAEDITSDVVSKVICALRKIIDQDLRATGSSLIDGLAKLVLVDVKARSAEYVKLNGRTILLKAKGPHRRVYGRVQWRVGVWSPVCV